MVEGDQKYLFDKIFQKIQMMPHVTFFLSYHMRTNYWCALQLQVQLQVQLHEFILEYMYKMAIFIFYEKIFHPLFVTNIIGNLLFVGMLIFNHKCRLQLQMTFFTSDIGIAKTLESSISITFNDNIRWTSIVSISQKYIVMLAFRYITKLSTTF